MELYVDSNSYVSFFHRTTCASIWSVCCSYIEVFFSVKFIEKTKKADAIFHSLSIIFCFFFHHLLLFCVCTVSSGAFSFILCIHLLARDHENVWYWKSVRCWIPIEVFLLIFGSLFVYSPSASRSFSIIVFCCWFCFYLFVDRNHMKTMKTRKIPEHMYYSPKWLQFPNK